MNNKHHYINIAAFVLLIVIITPILLFGKRETVSETERRELEKFPEFTFEALFSGEYAKGLSVYFSDTAPERERLIAVFARLNAATGISADGVRLHNAVRLTEEESAGSETIENSDLARPPDVKTSQITELPEASKPAETSEISEVSERQPEAVDAALTELNEPNSSNWDGEIEEVAFDLNAVADVANNGILVSENRGMMLYGGNKSQGERYAKILNRYYEALNSDNQDSKPVNVYSVVVPTSIEFYCPNNYRRLTADQRDNINHINNFLENVIPVNVYSKLAEVSKTINGEEIYLRTDHHWASLGAYYAVEEFCKSAGVDFANLSEYEKVTINNYVGTMYGYSGDVALKNNPEDFIYYKPLNNDYKTTYYDYKNFDSFYEGALFVKQSVDMSYCVFMGGDAKVTRINTNVDNQRRLAVFKDSFGNALIPFLTGSFEEIIVIDIRYFPYNAVDFLKDNGVTDVLFCNNIFAANTASLIDYIENML